MQWHRLSILMDKVRGDLKDFGCLFSYPVEGKLHFLLRIIQSHLLCENTNFP